MIQRVYQVNVGSTFAHTVERSTNTFQAGGNVLMPEGLTEKV